MNKSSACLSSFFPVVDLRLLEESPLGPCEKRNEDEVADSGSDLHLPAGVTSLQHWIDLNA